MINFLKFIYLILALLLNKELQIESETQIFEKPLHLLFSGVQTKTPEVECSATVVRAYLLHYFCLISGTYM